MLLNTCFACFEATFLWFKHSFYRYILAMSISDGFTSVLCARIIRAFLVEEQKIVKKVLKIQKLKEKVSAKS